MSDGYVERFKDRIVTGTNNQIYGTNYTDTYASVVYFSIVRFVLFLVVTMRWIAQIGIKTAFLNCYMNEEVFLCPLGIYIVTRHAYIDLKSHSIGSKKNTLIGIQKCVVICKTCDLKIFRVHSVFSDPQSSNGIPSFILVYIDYLFCIYSY